jgi:hypothetical protein
VTATLDGGQAAVAPVPPSPPARFRILEPARRADLERDRAASAGSHLVLGVVFAQAGLLDDAERELRALARENPQSDLARRLLQSVEARRRP